MELKLCSAGSRRWLNMSFTVKCPLCGSLPGKPCYGNGPMREPHPARVRAQVQSGIDALVAERDAAIARAEKAEAELKLLRPTIISGGCQGPGSCHGSQKWCDKCGNVSSVCDFALCDTHNPERLNANVQT